ncbi:uncharacterized protein [Argopecten irradians]|uniref:uncharacterized protein n=1 Tax=Argopecten irradians TaxID=31199 RepID=UPI0037241BD4
MTKLKSPIRSLFILCVIPYIYGAVLPEGASPRKQRRMLNKAMRQLAKDPLLSPGLHVSEFAPVPLDLMHPDLVDPLLMPSPLESLLNEHQGLLPTGLGPKRPEIDPVTREIMNQNIAIGTRESLRANRQIKKGLRKARKQFRQEKRARKQIRKQQRMLRKAVKQGQIIGNPHDVMSGLHDVMGGPHDIMSGLHGIGSPYDIIGVSSPISPLHLDHHVAEDHLLDGALNINKQIAKQDKKAIKQIKKHQKLVKKIAKQAKLVDKAMDLIPLPEPLSHLHNNILIGGDPLNIKKIRRNEKKKINKIKKQQTIMKKVVKQAERIHNALDNIPLPEPIAPLQPDLHLTDKILINNAVKKNIAQNLLINDAINNQHIADKLLVNDALNKDSLLGGLHDTHIHTGDAIIQVTKADHSPHHPHHPPPQHKEHHPQPKPNPIKALAKGVLLGGIGSMLLGK